VLRAKLGIPAGARIVGNISYIYPPKYFLGARVGLKGHEELIDALSIVIAKNKDVYGVLVGNTLPGYPESYEKALRRRAFKAGCGRILMPGYLSGEAVRQSWPDFDCAVHVPHSENCGGVVEPLSAGVPVIAAAVGGLPEVVIDNITGRIVRDRSAEVLAQNIGQVLEDIEHWRELAARGRCLVERMFDVDRTAEEVLTIYRCISAGSPRPESFDSRLFVTQAAELAAV
jgi:glycosyltransferase involved in cell wall biosynthesis